MKKIARIFASVLTVASISLAPVAVHAQDVIPVDGVDGLSSGGGTTAVQAPNTGIAPSNKLAQNAAVFAVGGALGAGLGFGIVAVRKKKFNS